MPRTPTFRARPVPHGGLVLLAMSIATLTTNYAAAQQIAGQRQTKLTASTRLEYNSNVLGSAAPGADTGDRSAGDWRLSPALNINAVRPIGRQSVFLIGSAGYDFYRRSSYLNRERINLSGGGDLSYLGSCHSHLQLDYARQQSDLADIIDPLNRATVKNLEKRVGYSGDIGCGGSVVGLRPTFGYAHSSVRNSSALREISDFVSDTYTAQLGYVSPSLGVISLYGNYTDGDYPKRTGLIDGQFYRDGIRVYGAGLQYERSFGTRLSGRGSVGVTTVDPKTPGVAKFTGLSYELAATYSSDPLRLTLSGSRGAQQSNLLGVAYLIQTSIGFNTTYELGPRIQLISNASYQHRDYKSTPLLPGSIARGGDNLINADAGARYRIGRRISVLGQVGYQRRSANVNVLDYTNKRISLTGELSL